MILNLDYGFIILILIEEDISYSVMMLKKMSANLFTPLWCKKCKRRGDHVLIALENPEKENAASFECQECGEIKRIALIDLP